MSTLYFHQIPTCFCHTNALAGLKAGGVVRNPKRRTGSPDAVWQSIPEPYRRIIVDKRIRLFYLDAFKIAREEASDPDLQLRMQGIAFQGAFFAASPVAEQAGLSDRIDVNAGRNSHPAETHKFGAKGARIVEENLSVVKRGFDRSQIRARMVKSSNHLPSATAAAARKNPQLPVLLRDLSLKARFRASDIHRFWEETGSFYARGHGQRHYCRSI